MRECHLDCDICPWSDNLVKSQQLNASHFIRSGNSSSLKRQLCLPMTMGEECTINMRCPLVWTTAPAVCEHRHPKWEWRVFDSVLPKVLCDVCLLYCGANVVRTLSFHYLLNNADWQNIKVIWTLHCVLYFFFKNTKTIPSVSFGHKSKLVAQCKKICFTSRSLEVLVFNSILAWRSLPWPLFFFYTMHIDPCDHNVALLRVHLS